MTGRRLALELSRRQLGGLEGRNDIFELNAATKARFAGVVLATREAEHLALNTRVWMDLKTGKWECRATAGKAIQRDTTEGMLERIIRAVSAVTDELTSPLHMN